MALIQARPPKYLVQLLAGVLLAGAALQTAQAASIAQSTGGQIESIIALDQEQLKGYSAVDLSTDFVDRMIHDLPVERHLAIFRSLNSDELAAQLDTDSKRLAFWINIYNGFTQYFLKQDPSLYIKDRGAFFKKPQIPIAGYQLSMHEIEHGVLRRGATIWSLGYVRLLWARSDFARKFAVDSVDYRIHFALNCGALSCPPVVAYHLPVVERQLDDSSALYLQQQVQYDIKTGTLFVPRLLLWFTGDFGSRRDKLEILQHHGALPAGKIGSLKYLPYDWSIFINNYHYFSYP